MFSPISLSFRLSRLLAFPLLCLACSLPLAAQTSKKIRSLQKEQTTLKKNIAEQEKILRSTKKDVKSQLANLQIINVQIEGQRKYVAGIHSELTELATTIGGLERQLNALENDLNDCKRKYRRAVTYMFRNRMRLSKWQFILSAKDFRQMYRRMRYMTEFSRYQRAQGRIIQRKEEEVRAKRAELLGVKQEKDRLYSEGQAETRKLQGQQQERKTMVDELNKKQAQLQTAIAQQRKKAAALDARIDQLIQKEIAAAAERRRKAEAERKRREEAARQARLRAEREKAAAERLKKQTVAANRRENAAETEKTSARRNRSSAKAKTPSAPVFNETPDSDRALSGSFAANRGRLPMPITGGYAITTHYGTYNVDGLRGVQLDSKGINITGRPGAQARCVFKGEVTAVFPYGGLYNVIVRHGSYMSVYCNLSSLSVHRGQQVEARQALGSVATDASGNCTLHFQLRKETAKLNPEAWLGR